MYSVALLDNKNTVFMPVNASGQRKLSSFSHSGS